MMSLASTMPEATCGSIGVKRIKLSSLIRTISISSSLEKYDSNFLVHSIPANPPPRTTILLVFFAISTVDETRHLASNPEWSTKKWVRLQWSELSSKGFLAEHQ